MGNDNLLTDDYVADLLAQEAKDCSLKYSTMGMEAYTSSSSSSSSRFAPCTTGRYHYVLRSRLPTDLQTS